MISSTKVIGVHNKPPIKGTARSRQSCHFNSSWGYIFFNDLSIKKGQTTIDQHFLHPKHFPQRGQHAL